MGLPRRRSAEHPRRKRERSMITRQRPGQPVFVLTLRAEPHVADTIKALRRGLKFLLRVCGLRAISAVELVRSRHDQTDPHPDPTKAAEESESLLDEIAGAP